MNRYHWFVFHCIRLHSLHLYMGFNGTRPGIGSVLRRFGAELVQKLARRRGAWIQLQRFREGGLRRFRVSGPKLGNRQVHAGYLESGTLRQRA